LRLLSSLGKQRCLEVGVPVLLDGTGTPALSQRQQHGGSALQQLFMENYHRDAEEAVTVAAAPEARSVPMALEC
jgi:hypothetical protein